MKNEENRTAKQQEIFEAVMAANLEVSKAHYAKETFKTLFDKVYDEKIVQENFIDWTSAFYKYNIKELIKVILRLLSHSKGVVNAMISLWSNSMAERLNGKVQEIKLSARGYKTFKNFRSAILFFNEGLFHYPLNSA